MEREILNLIEKSSNVLIITHVNPDGDTLGCASALKSYIGKKADILLQINDNSNFPTTYYFLPHIKEALNFSSLQDKYDQDKYNLIIAVDCASKDRIIAHAREIFDNCPNTIVIDHHKTNKGYGKINYIKGGISSTAEVLFEILKDNLTKEIATGLYVGILTDTGCFKYESTTDKTLNIAKKLYECGINISEIADLCYTNKPKNMILFQSYLVSNAKFICNDKIAYTLIPFEIQDKFKASDEYTEGIVETLRSIRGVEIAFVLKETKFGMKVSIRTKEIDATKIVSKFNGGGHKRAAGCTIKEKLMPALDLLIKEAVKLI